MGVSLCMCVLLRTYARGRVRVCVRACVRTRVCVCAHVCVHLYVGCAPAVNPIREERFNPSF